MLWKKIMKSNVNNLIFYSIAYQDYLEIENSTKIISGVKGKFKGNKGQSYLANCLIFIKDL